MHLAPTRFLGRERVDSALQSAVQSLRAGNRAKKNPCRPEKVAAIKQTFRRFAFL